MSRARESSGEHPESAEQPALPPTAGRLTKRDVEVLVSTYDDEPVLALLAALRVVGAPDDLCTSVPTMSEPERDSLLKDLIEWRGPTPPTGTGINS